MGQEWWVITLCRALCTRKEGRDRGYLIIIWQKNVNSLKYRELDSARPSYYKPSTHTHFRQQTKPLGPFSCFMESLYFPCWLLIATTCLMKVVPAPRFAKGACKIMQKKRQLRISPRLSFPHAFLNQINTKRVKFTAGPWTYGGVSSRSPNAKSVSFQSLNFVWVSYSSKRVWIHTHVQT
jgi:hypothetical protein